MTRGRSATLVLSGALVAMVWLGAAHGAAQASLISGLGGTAGFGSGLLPANDDSSSASIPLGSAFPSGLRFFGATHTAVFVNNNGNITFSGPVGSFTPTPFPIAAQPMIAPWWGDVDTGAPLPDGQNLVYWDVSPGRFIATWYNVGYYSRATNRLNAFQVVLTDRSAAGEAGDFDVEFRYNRCEWTTGDASEGTDGLGGTPAQAGFDAGNLVDYLEIPGSRTAAVLELCTTSNVGETGIWRFQVRSGAVTQRCGNGTLEAGEECDDGNNTSGDGCSAICTIERDNGASCDSDGDCRSGFCTDGVCCDGRCDGQCEACNRAGSAGSCGAATGAPVGARPACAGAGTTCGGTCNGSARLSCTFPGSATSCDDGAFCTVGDSCSGAGSCTPGGPRSCADTLACTADTCDEAADTCRNTLTGGCIIDAACVAAGATNPSNPCLVCAPATSTTAWSPASAGSACSDGLFCTVGDACNGAGTCTGSPRNCADALTCTADTCDEAADTCRNTLTGGCIIDAACVAAGATNPSNPCLVCSPATSTTGWSPASAGAACSDGRFCTVGDACDGAGTCTGSARDCGDGLACTADSCNDALAACVSTVTTGCVIDGACVANGAANPANPCLICASSVSTSAWSPAAAGALCDDGLFCTVGDACNGAGSCSSTARGCSDALACTVDTCDEAADVCVNTLAEGCVIDGACVPEGTTSPGNPCLICAPSVSSTDWSPASAGSACDDGLFCTVDDACDGAGTCASAPRDCSDGIDCTLDLCDEEGLTCESRVVETCRIDGVCIPETTRNPLNPCEVCDPARDTASWSPTSAGTTCDDGVFCTDEDTCDGEGLCVGAERSCDDERACTSDLCDEAAAECTHTLTTGCLVDGACVSDGESSPEDACQVCDPSMSTASYSASGASECQPDGGVGMPDGGPRDGGVQADASMETDAGLSYRVSGGGCGCRATGAAPSRASLGAMLLLALGLVARRRRR